MRRSSLVAVPASRSARRCRRPARARLRRARRSGIQTARRRASSRAARIERLEQWLKAVARHAPGEDDAPLAEIAGWPNARPETVCGRRQRAPADRYAPHRRRRQGAADAVRCEPKGRRRRRRCATTTEQLHRLQVLACAAGGLVVRERLHVDQGGRRARCGAAADRRSRPRVEAARRRQLHHPPRRDPAQRRGDAGAGVDGRAGSVGRPVAGSVERFRMEISDGQELESPPVGGALGDRAHAARLRPAARQRSRRSRARRHGAPVVPRDRGVDAADARITTSCTSIARAAVSRPIPTSCSSAPASARPTPARRFRPRCDRRCCRPA